MGGEQPRVRGVVPQSVAAHHHPAGTGQPRGTDLRDHVAVVVVAEPTGDRVRFRRRLDSLRRDETGACGLRGERVVGREPHRAVGTEQVHPAVAEPADGQHAVDDDRGHERARRRGVGGGDRLLQHRPLGGRGGGDQSVRANLPRGRGQWPASGVGCRGRGCDQRLDGDRGRRPRRRAGAGRARHTVADHGDRPRLQRHAHPVLVVPVRQTPVADPRDPAEVGFDPVGRRLSAGRTRRAGVPVRPAGRAEAVAVELGRATALARLGGAQQGAARLAVGVGGECHRGAPWAPDRAVVHGAVVHGVVVDRVRGDRAGGHDVVDVRARIHVRVLGRIRFASST